MLKPWVAALSATLLMQTVGTFLGQTIPVVAPLMTAELGLRPETVGNFSSVNTLGAILFLLFGTPFVARHGPLRMLQFGALVGSLALLAAAAGIVWLLPVAALVMGIGYGPTGPAGSRILQATAPPRHRVLIFSVKQAGAPAGGALAGLVAAPIAALYGWQAALLSAIVVALACAVLIQPLRPQLDAEREPQRPWRDAFTAKRLAAPVNALRMHRVLPPLTLQAFAFAALQGSLFSFTVTWLVERHGYSLTAAGSLFAAMQVAGVVGRLVLGWAADRLGDATRSLSLHGLVAAALSAAWVLLGPDAPAPLALLLAVGAGFTAASWNGIFLAEVARVAPADRVAEASSGAILLCFLGYLSAPTAFAWAVTMTGSWTLPYLVACGLLAVVSLVVFALRVGDAVRNR
ncbi:MFS transporter [Falsiroseomonas selenitidurans]|uniref:MFS transporter n=1 Tax=Falsiroseomonas selenitidurans TaxID=2716335 RepID=A0ABX1E9L7_9PROT|nr:MFS transporter [Falsiroseomonas selenitidurans]NKC32457.1 MFS transporter [Falsiroseomonas selenitidurans]